MAEKLDRLTISLPKELKKRVKAKAAMEEVTLSFLISSWLEAWIKGELETPQNADVEA